MLLPIRNQSTNGVSGLYNGIKGSPIYNARMPKKKTLWSKTTPLPRRLLFLLDYDGTLTDFVRDPEKSFISPKVRGLLRRLRRKHPVILVSGRYLRSLKRVSGLKEFPMVGTHGFESQELPGGLRLATPAQKRRYQREAGILWRNLQALKRKYPEVHIEHKPFSSTLHFRGTGYGAARIRGLHRDFRKVYRTSVTTRHWALMEGKKMIEAKPKGFSKGKAVRKILERVPDRFPIFAGDDVTDIQALKALGRKGLRIAVGDRIPRRYHDLKFASPKAFLGWLGVFSRKAAE